MNLDTWITDFAMRSDTDRSHHSVYVIFTQRHSELAHCTPNNTVLHCDYTEKNQDSDNYLESNSQDL